MEFKKFTEQKDVSRLGFGAWPLGNISRGVKMPFDDGVSLVKKALDEGITFFDTAPNYAHGESERILGEALKDKRDTVVINSKFGHNEFDEINFDENEIIPSIKRSLQRLKTDYLDSILLHNPSMDALVGKTGHYKMLKEAKNKGLIKAYGVSIDSKEELQAVLEYGNVDVIELLFNMFFQDNRSLLDDIKKQGIKLIIKVPLDSGWLTGTYHQNMAFTGVKSRWSKENRIRREHLVDKLSDTLKTDQLIKYAISFILSYDSVTTVIPGIRTIHQLKEHLEAESFELSKEEKKKIEKFYDEHIRQNPLSW